jgi:hypothetical protein
MKSIGKKNSKFHTLRHASGLVLLVSLVYILFLFFYACQKIHYWDLCDVNGNEVLQTSLFDTNLYHNATIIDDQILLFNPRIINNMFLLEEQKFGYTFNNLLIDNSPFQYPISVTADLEGNYYVLDSYLEHRIRLHRFFVDEPTQEYRIYRYHPNSKELHLIKVMPDTLNDCIVFLDDHVKIIFCNNQLFLLGLNQNGRHVLFSIPDDQTVSLSTLHEFKEDILCTDFSLNHIAVLTKDGFINCYELKDEQLNLIESISLPKNILKNRDEWEYRLIYSKVSNKYTLYASELDGMGQRIIRALYMYEKGHYVQFYNIPREIISITKSTITNNQPKERMFIFSNREGLINKSLLKEIGTK